MPIINIHEAKTQFSKLVEAAMNGEETIIAKSGTPVAKLIPILPKKPKHQAETIAKVLNPGRDDCIIANKLF